MRLGKFIGFAISFGLIVWLLIGIDWRETGKALEQVNPWYLALMSGVFLVQVYLRALRWRYLLPPHFQSVGDRELFDAIMVGQLANFILPLRAGEFARPAMLAKISPVDFGNGFGSVVLERLFDLLAVLVAFAVVVQGLPGLPGWVIVGAESLFWLAIVITVFFVVAVSLPRHSKALAHRLIAVPGRYLSRHLNEALARFTDGVFNSAEVLRSPTQTIAVVLYTVAVWFGTYIFFYFTFSAMGWEPDLFQSVALTVIVALSVAAPSAPGFVGVYQTACVAGFVLFGGSAADGLAFSVVNHILQYVLISVIGTAVLYIRGLNLKSVTS